MGRMERRGEERRKRVCVGVKLVVIFRCNMRLFDRVSVFFGVSFVFWPFDPIVLKLLPIKKEKSK